MGEARKAALYRVRKGTDCVVRKAGTEVWRPYTTTKGLSFRAAELSRDGWEMRVFVKAVTPPLPVTRREARAKAGGASRPADRRDTRAILFAVRRPVAERKVPGFKPASSAPVAAPGDGVDEWRESR